LTALFDTNVLVYRYDPRSPDKQRIAEDLLRWAVEGQQAYVAHQALVEMFAATTRPRRDGSPPLLTREEAAREIEELLAQVTVLYPREGIVRLALRGAAVYGFSWFDAHLWAYAEHHEIPELWSEDFEHGRIYGRVRAVNPFRPADTLHEPAARYGP
jgi:predicted nucleic acid-binding protein